jgi:hypothetical protein
MVSSPGAESPISQAADPSIIARIDRCRRQSLKPYAYGLHGSVLVVILVLKRPIAAKPTQKQQQLQASRNGIHCSPTELGRLTRTESERSYSSLTLTLTLTPFACHASCEGCI